MIVAWHGWRIEVPGRWSPVRLEGDGEQGYLLMADLHRPRLGVRWKKLGGKRPKMEQAAQRAMAQEIGALAAAEAKATAPATGQWISPLAYEDKEPPGRDVWVGYSPESQRLFELVYHAHHRDRVLVDRVLPTLLDGQCQGATEWSIFDLSCRVPGGLSLMRQRLNAGDLSLMFQGSRKRAVTIRQIAVAKLALQRRSLDRWVAEQAAWRGKYFKPAGDAAQEQEEPRVIQQPITRRRRYSWMWWLPAGFVALAKHDAVRDRLVIVDATDESLAREVMESVAWARAEET